MGERDRSIDGPLLIRMLNVLYKKKSWLCQDLVFVAGEGLEPTTYGL